MVKGLLCSCLECKRELPAKGLHTHIDRAHNGATHYSSGRNNSYSILSLKSKNKKLLNEISYLKNPKYCMECGNPVQFNKRANKFCSHKCSTTSNNRCRTDSGWSPTLAHRKKTAESLTGKEYVVPVLVNVQCPCGREHSHMSNVSKIYCSRRCSAIYSPKHIARREIIRANRPALSNYRADCAFKFKLRDYPNEFNFSLIEEYGWYKPKNRGNNLNGVSRDHMVSVRYGFDNNLPTEHLSHPANCRLLRHNDNISKNSKNYITYKELLNRIMEWDKKYKWGQ